MDDATKYQILSAWFALVAKCDECRALLQTIERNLEQTCPAQALDQFETLLVPAMETVRSAAAAAAAFDTLLMQHLKPGETAIAVLDGVTYGIVRQNLTGHIEILVKR